VKEHSGALNFMGDTLFFSKWRVKQRFVSAICALTTENGLAIQAANPIGSSHDEDEVPPPRRNVFRDGRDQPHGRRMPKSARSLAHAAEIGWE